MSQEAPVGEQGCGEGEKQEETRVARQLAMGEAESNRRTERWIMLQVRRDWDESGHQDDRDDHRMKQGLEIGDNDLGGRQGHREERAKEKKEPQSEEGVKNEEE